MLNDIYYIVYSVAISMLLTDSSFVHQCDINVAQLQFVAKIKFSYVNPLYQPIVTILKTLLHICNEEQISESADRFFDSHLKYRSNLTRNV